MILLTIVLYDIIAVIVTVAALLCAYADWMHGLLICGVIAGIALIVTGYILAMEK